MIIEIPTKRDRYNEGFESETITVHGGRFLGTTHFSSWDKGRRVFQGPVIESPFAALIQHATVIDFHGGSGRIAAEAPIHVNIGDLVRFENFPGVWSIQERDERRLQGGGHRIIPAGTDPKDYGYQAESADAVEPVTFFAPVNA